MRTSKHPQLTELSRQARSANNRSNRKFRRLDSNQNKHGTKNRWVANYPTPDRLLCFAASAGAFHDTDFCLTRASWNQASLLIWPSRPGTSPRSACTRARYAGLLRGGSHGRPRRRSTGLCADCASSDSAGVIGLHTRAKSCWAVPGVVGSHRRPSAGRQDTCLCQRLTELFQRFARARRTRRGRRAGGPGPACRTPRAPPAPRLRFPPVHSWARPGCARVYG